MRTWPYHLLALFVVVCWGLSMVSTKVLLDYGVGPWAIVVLRVVLAYGLLIFLAPMRFFAGSLRAEVTVALLGILNVPIYFGLQTIALQTAQASTVSVLVAMGPALTGILALIVLRKFRLHWMTLLGICAAATGLFLLYFDNVLMNALPLRGFLFGIGAAVAYAAYSLGLRALADLPALFVLRKSSGYGLLAALPFYLVEPETEAMLLAEPVVYLNFLFLALVVSAGGWCLWQKAECRIGANASHWYLFLWPLTAIVAGIVILNENMTYIGIMGAGMILCGVVCAQKGLAKVALEIARRW